MFANLYLIKKFEFEFGMEFRQVQIFLLDVHVPRSKENFRHFTSY